MEEVSILIPVYKRHEFLALTLQNIKMQEYPHGKLTVVIDECLSDEPFIRDGELGSVIKYLHPINVIHHVYQQRATIGEKRNRLVKMSHTKYCQFFDSDDLYKPSCISYNHGLLKEKRVKCVGSDKMLFCYLLDGFKMSGINCGGKINLIHEATMFFDRKWFASTAKFERNSMGEGRRLFEGLTSKLVHISDIHRIMICLVHNTNTVPKDIFKKGELPRMREDAVVWLKGILQMREA